MAPISPPVSESARDRPLRVGFIPLTDAAPLIVAQELGFFSRQNLRVELSRQVGWATIREKIVYGELEAAHAPAPMLWDVHLGLGSAPCPVLTSLVLNLNGNAITLSERLYAEGGRDAASLRELVRSRRGERRITLGVVFQFSSHHLLLRDWLQAAGINPERDVRIVVVPPAQMFRNLTAGTIDGYCVGEPWNSLAVRAGAGWCPMWSAAFAPGHMEKVLMMSQRFADARPGEHARLLLAIHEAAAWCDAPQNRERLAEMLSSARYLNVPARVISPALLGRFDCGHGRIENVPEFHVFHRGGASFPSVEKAEALQRALSAANLVPPATPADLPRRLFREDLLRSALEQHLPLAASPERATPAGRLANEEASSAR
ncbi:MAG: CmpA/NrtA family ABC transporter substrate-binding protein [Opitutaceae bacterium]